VQQYAFPLYYYIAITSPSLGIPVCNLQGIIYIESHEIAHVVSHSED